MTLVTIGLEVHAQLLTRTKIFCGCENSSAGQPNSRVCPVCLGLPGVLPVLNKRAVEMIVRTGKALHCTIAARSIFARKNYFYPDLPKNYQISQYEEPVCQDGYLPIEVRGQTKKVRIRRIHLEEDAGKLIHLESGEVAVDLNRAGAPLMEIVTEPDLESAEEAIAYLQTLKQSLQVLDVCTGNMEEGHLRVEPNVSIRLRADEPLGTKVELKNINSFRFAQRAIVYEVERQCAEKEKGVQIRQETRRYDEKRGVTLPMRSKEEASDYRYFPEPDLLPLTVPKELLQDAVASLPEMPWQKKVRLRETFGLNEKEVNQLLEEPALADYFEQTVQACPYPKQVANFLLNEVQGRVRAQNLSWEHLPITPAEMASLLSAIQQNDISVTIAKKILRRVWEGKSSLAAAMTEETRSEDQHSDLLALARTIVAEQPDAVAKIQKGKEQAIQFLIGQMMRRTKGRADPQEAKKVLQEAIHAEIENRK